MAGAPKGARLKRISSISGKDVRDLEEVFKRIDMNGDGRLSAEELRAALQKVPGIDAALVADVANRIVERADINEDGFVDMSELGLAVHDDTVTGAGDISEKAHDSASCCAGFSCAGCLSRMLLACCCVCGGDGGSQYGSSGGRPETQRRLDEHRQAVEAAKLQSQWQRGEEYRGVAQAVQHRNPTSGGGGEAEQQGSSASGGVPATAPTG